MFKHVNILFSLKTEELSFNEPCISVLAGQLLFPYMVPSAFLHKAYGLTRQPRTEVWYPLAPLTLLAIKEE